MNVFQTVNIGDMLLQRFTLIKKLSPHVFIATDSLSGEKIIIKQTDNEQLHREWQCMQQCQSPYIIQTVEYIASSSLLVLPYLNGQSMLTFSLKQRSLFISLIPKIVRAITHIHQNGWVHGDIKPSNIIYQPALGSIKIIDFGAAWPAGTPLALLPQWQLTPQFSRENKLQGICKIEPKDDWYALSIWLEQIAQESLTLRDKSKLKNWKIWVENKY